MIHNRVNGGLCYYLSKNYVSKKLQKWIKRIPFTYYREGIPIYWYIPPMDCNTRHEAIEALQYRVDKMKQLLKKY